MNIEDYNIAWGDHISAHVKGNRSQSEHRNSEKNQSISILTISGETGKTCASMGLINCTHTPPVEILMDSIQTDLNQEALAASVAFSILEGELTIKPGAIHENAVQAILPELSLAHLLFTPQFQWDYAMSEVELPEGNIYPLLAVPVSDLELLYLRQFGYGTLEHLWERREIDLLDWKRTSAVSQLDIDRALIKRGLRSDH